MSCHSEESRSPGRRRISAVLPSNAEILPPDRVGSQDDTATRARARSTAPLTPCGAWDTTFCFERWGLNQAGGLAVAAVCHRRKGPTCLKPLSESLSRIYLLGVTAGTMRKLPCAPAFVLAIRNNTRVQSRMQEKFLVCGGGEFGRKAVRLL